MCFALFYLSLLAIEFCKDFLRIVLRDYLSLASATILRNAFLLRVKRSFGLGGIPPHSSRKSSNCTWQ
jgi:hypothetical protein